MIQYILFLLTWYPEVKLNILLQTCFSCLRIDVSGQPQIQDRSGKVQISNLITKGGTPGGENTQTKNSKSSMKKLHWPHCGKGTAK